MYYETGNLHHKKMNGIYVWTSCMRRYDHLHYFDGMSDKHVKLSASFITRKVGNQDLTELH